MLPRIVVEAFDHVESHFANANQCFIWLSAAERTFVYDAFRRTLHRPGLATWVGAPRGKKVGRDPMSELTSSEREMVDRLLIYAFHETLRLSPPRDAGTVRYPAIFNNVLACWLERLTQRGAIVPVALKSIDISEVPI